MKYGDLDPENRPYFYSKEGIRIHMQLEHETEDMKFQCYTCGSKFKYAMGLKLHSKLMKHN